MCRLTLVLAAFAMVATLTVFGCGGSPGTPTSRWIDDSGADGAQPGSDAAPVDSGPTDGGPVDGAPLDGAPTDAGSALDGGDAAVTYACPPGAVNIPASIGSGDDREHHQRGPRGRDNLHCR